ncbi:hypothetical protein FOMPIDRAFT_95055 [Fomitopsis schrenkii]|uniref:Uncharacterized protein n=1 Tax=Fomitopsis schrenkii TaxID=2126942 RepID=S8F0C4_FOMSC|nr:hypothetical protein FOMPIDRAFT_95055 [Fomitopsis schrenkii]
MVLGTTIHEVSKFRSGGRGKSPPRLAGACYNIAPQAAATATNLGSRERVMPRKTTSNALPRPSSHARTHAQDKGCRRVLPPES